MLSIGYDMSKGTPTHTSVASDHTYELLMIIADRLAGAEIAARQAGIARKPQWLETRSKTSDSSYGCSISGRQALVVKSIIVHEAGLW